MKGDRPGNGPVQTSPNISNRKTSSRIKAPSNLLACLSFPVGVFTFGFLWYCYRRFASTILAICFPKSFHLTYGITNIAANVASTC
jgi:hypothetical protein